ncbi:MAG: fatty acid desaturase [Candidatus Promineifilaceae bacterium]|jgi:omega-6 fatty acid desaturase (delta-12 desaturase)
MAVDVGSASSKINPQSDWKKIVKPYQTADMRRSVWQAVHTFGLFFAGWILAYLSLSVSYWLTLLIAVPTAGFLVRLFIIQHDCGHGSFFNNRQWNDRLGGFCGLFTLVPYYQWRKSHAIHHANSGKLNDMRGTGDVYTMTVDEYFQASKWRRLGYRIFRNSFFLIGLAPFFAFVFGYRFPYKFAQGKSWEKERQSVYWTNLGILILAGLTIWAIGLKSFLLVQIPITYVATSVGVWFFFVQHQYEDAYWADEEEWNYVDAALKGSSYYRLPKLLQWFSGNIGFHHIHHLSPRIPNYKLEEAYRNNALFQDVNELTLRSSFSVLKLGLWDEDQQRLITFQEAHARHAAQSG